MSIKRIEVYTVDLPYLQPFTISLGTSTSSTDVVVKVLDDEGRVGWGEASPARRIIGESEHTIVAAMHTLAPAVIGEDPMDVERIEEKMDKAILGNNSAKFALETAVFDLKGKILGVTVRDLLGGYRDRVETDFTIGIKSPEEMAEEALRIVERGFRVIKLKVGTGVEEDVARVRAVRDAVGKDIRLRIDANQGWTVKEAMRALTEMDRYDLELAEQPVRWDDLEGMAVLTSMSPIPIMADESVHTPEDALEVVEMGAADYINIKLTKAGGLLKARRIAAISEAAGIPNMIGCMMEGGVSITAGVHFAAATRNLVTTDLDSDISLKEDFVEGGAGYEDGYRTVPDGPGLGNLKVKEEKLKLKAVFEEGGKVQAL
ncbi:MAG: dipeptide epimerase [Candidatus Korarchaeota archaeon]|nr:dipeptide epimerase [Candidatus Korarchaeota archaeon]